MIFGFDEYKTIIELMRSFRPDIVITQHPLEYGRFDHMDAGEFAIRCVEGRHGRVRVHDSPRPSPGPARTSPTSPKMDIFMASIDGAVGYVSGTGYGEQLVRFNPAKVQYLPAG